MTKGVKQAGRVAGTPNKHTAAVKEMILNALESAGGEDYLFNQAIKNPTAFMTLLGKTVPSDLNAKLSGLVNVKGVLEVVPVRNKLQGTDT